MLPTEEDIEKVEIISPMLNSVYSEMKEFAKKKPDENLNELKVKVINKILEQIKEILLNEPTIKYLDLLDDVMLPSNSDAVLILTQYKSALNNFRSKYYYTDELGIGRSRWHTDENP